MKSKAQSHNRDREATTPRFRLGLFVVAELLCTGALVVWVFLLQDAATALPSMRGGWSRVCRPSVRQAIAWSVARANRRVQGGFYLGDERDYRLSDGTKASAGGWEGFAEQAPDLTRALGVDASGRSIAPLVPVEKAPGS